MALDQTRSRLINFKVNAKEYEEIDRLCKEHAGGNMSLWLRFRGSSLSAFPEDQALAYPDVELTQEVKRVSRDS